MVKLIWDDAGNRRFETGVDQGVLYPANPATGAFDMGYAWNGLTTVTESPAGAESNPQYADNMIYLNLLSAETFGGTIEAITYPDAWEQCDGSAQPSPGVYVGQQNRRVFGLAYRSKIGSDLTPDLGYKYHLIWNGLAAPSEKARETVNDSPAALGLSWDISTTPVSMTSVDPATGKTFKPTAKLTIDSTKVPAANLQVLLDALYGTAGSNPRLPTPDEVVAMFAGTVTSATPTVPTYTSATHTIAIPSVTGVQYRRTDTGAVVSGNVVLTTGQQVVIEARPTAGYTFPPNTDTTWQFVY